ncbi:TetR/AcrR family transcriptional regulator [Pseudonocardiaceae bacterium YIM PH 21723]|nr:TetR/AcrR family transcriptional regulator [Pseudonocardiaceae bacterium YIM PH 21723]
MTTVTASTDRPRARQPRMPIEVRREQVLDAALRLITEHGYAAATMEAIAREADLAKPRVYSAYPGRGPLLNALFERQEQRALATIAEAVPADFTGYESALDVLATAAENLMRAAAAEPAAWRLLVFPADEAPPEVRQHVHTSRTFAVDQLRVLLVWARTVHPGLAEVDGDLAAEMLAAAGERGLRLVLQDPDGYPPERFAAFVRSWADIFFR